MTREERNVLLFLAVGVLLGSLPEWAEEQSEPGVVSSGPDSARVVESDLYPIELNRASVRLLEQLPGIGPSKARAIVEYREANGAFRSLDDLRHVRGIGVRTVERLRELVVVEGTDREERRDVATREPVR